MFSQILLFILCVKFCIDSLLWEYVLYNDLVKNVITGLHYSNGCPIKFTPRAECTMVRDY